MRIEIIHQRDPDEGCDHTVFVDGVQFVSRVLVDGEWNEVEVYDIDPGRGHQRADWDRSTDDVCVAASPAAAKLLRELRNRAADSSPYVEA